MTLPAAAGMTREEVQNKCWQAGRNHGGPQSERDNITAQCFEQEGPAYSYDAMVYRESAKAAANLDRSIKEGMAKNIRDCTGGTLHIGDDKTAAIRAWCYPLKINTTETASGTHEQWVYPADQMSIGHSPRECVMCRPYAGYLYFENGRLTAIQQ
jgi:hypothetical protein